MKKIAVIFGTRPDTIKLAPVVERLRMKDDITVVPIATAQHREMLDDVLSVFRITPAYDLDVMIQKQSLSDLTQNILVKLDKVLSIEQPDMVVVQGDTATTFVAALAAFYHKVPVAHVEAGLRTNSKYYPFPEEIYRRLTSHMVDLHFTPTPAATKNLRKEGIGRASIVCTGNTVIDALKMTVQKHYTFTQSLLSKLTSTPAKNIIVTAHRRENIGEPLHHICTAIGHLATINSDVNFIFPVHRNPTVREVVFPLLGNRSNIYLIDPLQYGDFVNLVALSEFIITDSGGLQEEGPALGKPVLVLRDVTERPEALKFGTVKLVGTDVKTILKTAQKLIDDKKFYRSMARVVNPYGDGKASDRIVASLQSYFGIKSKKIAEFTPR